MSELLLEPDELRKAAGTFNESKNSLAELTKKLDETTKALETKWVGVSQEVFFKQYKELRQYLEGFGLILGNISREMEAMADRFEQADN